MAKGTWKQASKDDPIYNRTVVVSSKTTPKKSQPSTATAIDTKKIVVEEDDGHQCHYGDDQVIFVNKHILTFCLTLAVLLGSLKTSWSADASQGVNAYLKGNYATALSELTPLAEQGHALAQSFLGVMYHNGQGVSQDYKTAVKWYRLSAEQGLDVAQFELSRMYAEGKGVIQDYNTAIKWATYAAEQGFPGAHYFLAMSYEQGHGVVQDRVSAYMWANIAASNGHEYGLGFRNHIKKILSPSELRDGQKLARECIRKKYKGC